MRPATGAGNGPSVPGRSWRKSGSRASTVPGRTANRANGRGPRRLQPDPPALASESLRVARRTREVVVVEGRVDVLVRVPAAGQALSPWGESRPTIGRPA